MLVSIFSETDNSGGEADQSSYYDSETASDLDVTALRSHSIIGHKPALPHKFGKGTTAPLYREAALLVH